MDLKAQLLVAKEMMAGTEVPMMPAEVVQINRIFLQTEFPDVGEITEIIERNTTLSGELIKVANEPGFSQPNAEEVKSVKQAIDAIGMSRLKNLMTSLGFKGQIKGAIFDSILDHSIDVARVAAALAGWVEGVSVDIAYMAGLFHNAGAIILAMKYEDYEKYFLNTITNCYSGTVLELKRYKVTHGIYGLLVAQKWRLDKIMSQLILLHHQKDLSKIKNDQVRTLVALVQLANCIVSEVTFNNYMGSEIKQMMQTAKNELMIGSEVINEIRIAVLSNSL